MKVEFEIIKETEKAVYVCTQVGYGHNTTHYEWFPKSACEFQEFVATLDAFDNPATYGKRVVAIADWLAKKIR